MGKTLSFHICWRYGSHSQYLQRQEWDKTHTKTNPFNPPLTLGNVFHPTHTRTRASIEYEKAVCCARALAGCGTHKKFAAPNEWRWSEFEAKRMPSVGISNTLYIWALLLKCWKTTPEPILFAFAQVCFCTLCVMATTLSILSDV